MNKEELLSKIMETHTIKHHPIPKTTLEVVGLHKEVMADDGEMIYNTTVPPKFYPIVPESTCAYCDNRDKNGVLIMNRRTKEVKCRKCEKVQPKKMDDYWGQ